MGKGLGAGILSGGIVGAVVLSMLSLYAPLRQDTLKAAPKLEAEHPVPQTVTPQNTDTSASPQVELGTQTPATVVAPEVAPVEPADVQPAVTPEEATGALDVDSPAVATAQTTQDDSVITGSTEPKPAPLAQVETNIQAPTPDAPPTVEASTQEAALALQPTTVPSPKVVGTEQVPTVETPPKAAPRTSSLPSIGGQQAVVEPVSADTPITLPSIDTGVVTNRLPSLSGAATTPTPTTQITPEPAPEATPDDVGALTQFSSPVVEDIDGKALFSVVLIDSGEDGIPRADLAKLTIPITIAIDPTATNAQQIMGEYRAAGIEVVALANDLPTAAGPGDVATAISAYFDVLDQAVALMDPLDGRIQANRSLLQPVLGAIRDSGHGLITYNRGLNTAQQAARREDIPAATVFRVLDADLEAGSKIKRYLSRAAFNATRDGAVVVVGRSYPETVRAIVEWALEKKEAGIAVVPVSAIMLADQG